MTAGTEYSDIMAAAQAADMNAVRGFISSGAAVDARFEGGETALMAVVEASYYTESPESFKAFVETAAALVAAGADPDAADAHGRTARDRAYMAEEMEAALGTHRRYDA